MRTSSLITVSFAALATLITTASAGGALSNIAKVVKVVQGVPDLIQTGSDLAGRSTEISAVLTWVDAGHGFKVSNVPSEIIAGIHLWNALPDVVKLGAEEVYGKVEVVGPNEIYAYELAFLPL